MKQFKGKAIYNPSGKASEYSYWACNFYNGCSNGCEYCYCKKGLLKKTMGGDTATLKKCFQNEDHAMEMFTTEMLKNIDALREHGLFFSFTTDPMLPETIGLTMDAVNSCIVNGIPVKILTKCTDWVDDFLANNNPLVCDGKAVKKHKVMFLFTLTGHDELEPGASTNFSRIRRMKLLHEAGFFTGASIEPIIDFPTSKEMIRLSLAYCDMYKVGLLSGGKYDQVEAQCFVEWLNEIDREPIIYLKESIQKLTRYNPEDLGDNFVGRDYNIFKTERK